MVQPLKLILSDFGFKALYIFVDSVNILKVGENILDFYY